MENVNWMEDFFFFFFKLCMKHQEEKLYKIHINVLRKEGIGAIPELHLRKVGIPTLSADSRIVPDNSRIVQGKYMS